MDNNARSFIKERLKEISRIPDMYGSLEAVEFQVLTLLELLAYMNGRPGRWLIEKYQKYITTSFGSNPIYIHFHVYNHAELLTHLKKFQEEIGL